MKFDLVPDAPGRRTVCVRVLAPAGDRNPADKSREADIEIVDRKNHVLLMADGPMRDYQFLRNQLFRDRYTTLDVWLQSGRPGMSQEAKRTLDDFPTTRQEMYDYDCVVAFDPNWQALNAASVGIAGKVGGRAGGRPDRGRRAGKCMPRRRRLGSQLGHDHDPQAVSRRVCRPAGGHGRQRVCEPRAVAAGISHARGSMPTSSGWPTRPPLAGRLGTRFPACISCCPVRGPKPGATVYCAIFRSPRGPEAASSRSISPDSSTARGRVFYMGSGEMWRLRSLDEADFEQFYTKLIRHVSQGRLVARLQPRRAAGRAGSVYAGQHGGSAGPTDQRPARTARRANASTCK